MKHADLVKTGRRKLAETPARLRRAPIAARFALVLLASATPLFASQMVLSSSGGTAAMGSAFTVTGAAVASPAGTLSYSCPITSSGGTGPVTYTCSGGSFSFKSSDGKTSVSGVFATSHLYLTASGGGRGGNIHYYYQFFGNFSGVQHANGLAAAINGETEVVVGPLTAVLGSAAAGPGSTGVTSQYTPMYLTDYSFSQIVRSDDISGTNKVVFGSTGTSVNQFYGPQGVTVDASGRIYVVDLYNCRIVRVDDMTGKNWTTLGTCGSGLKQFHGSADIALDSLGRIYVADTGNSRIVRFDDMSGMNWTEFGTAGSGTDQLSGATGVTVDAAGHIYIADSGNRRLVRMDDMSGTNWTVLTQSPVINGYIYSFGSPSHVAIDNLGRIVVGDGTYLVRVNDMTGAGWVRLNLNTAVAGVDVDTYGTNFVAGTISSGGPGVVLLDDVATGAGYETTNLVGDPGGIYAVPAPKPVPAVKLSTSSLTFANQNINTTSAAQTVKLTNFGGAPLTATITASSQFSAASNCPASLPGGSSCTISVKFAPTMTGPQAGAVTITDNAFTGKQTIALSGTGTAPIAGIAPAALSFDPQMVATMSGAQLVILSNSGTGPLTFSGSGISTGAGEFVQSNDCGVAVQPGKACQISVTFAPTATGARSGTLTVTSNAAMQSVNLSGTGTSTAAGFKLNPESLMFPVQLVGTTSAAQSVVLTNTGATAMSVAAAISGDFAKSGSCPSSLAGGASCTLSVTFKPTVGGVRTGALTYTLPSGVATVALTGTATTTPMGWLTFTPSSLSFPGYVVGDNPSQTVKVVNSNGVAVGISKIAISGSGTFTQMHTCGTTLPAKGSCSITVTFMPTVVGSFTGSLYVTESGGKVDPIPLSGDASLGGP